MIMKNSLFGSEFTDELYRSMEKNLVVKQASDNNHGLTKLAKATEYLSAAAEIFEQAGMTEPAEEITEVLQDLAVEQLTSKAFSASDFAGLVGSLDKGTMHSILENSTPAQLMHLVKKVMSLVKGEKSFGDVAEESMKEADLSDPEVREKVIKKIMTGLQVAKFFV